MVKGISKRVVVVRFPETRVFEQAIFFVREDAAARPGVSAEQVLREACRAAEGYVHKNPGQRRLARMMAAVYLMAGAALTGLVWLAVTVL
ncbi:MAG: translation initiation factor 2 [Oscillospiraceae bacterium]|jgi:hypothetical protein|nr:translation initiation factor 2 [Oscillospiraceae bacterium]